MRDNMGWMSPAFYETLARENTPVRRTAFSSPLLQNSRGFMFRPKPRRHAMEGVPFPNQPGSGMGDSVDGLEGQGAQVLVDEGQRSFRKEHPLCSGNLSAKSRWTTSAPTRLHKP